MQLPKKIDPRIAQISILVFLVVYGTAFLDFPISAVNFSLAIISVVCFQIAFSEQFLTSKIDLKSCLISGLSLCLLLRMGDPLIAVFASFLAIGSKFLIRFNSKHLFNPTNFAIVVLVYLFPNWVWISPGQWDSTAYFAFTIVAFGAMIAAKARTQIISISYLFFFVSFLLIRSLWLGDPLSIPAHSLVNGGLLIFVFLMISDPKSTPDHRTARIIFAFAVALLTFILKFQFFEPKAPFIALFLLAPLTPILDMAFRARPFEWEPSKLSSNN